MADISLIPQNRIKDLSTTFDGCVHTTGNETIAGNKTFSGTTTFTTTPYVYKANTSELILKSSTADTTVTPESNYQVGHYVIADKNTKIGGYWYCEKRNDGGIRNGLETRKYSDDGSSYNHSALQVWRNKYDEGYLDFGATGTNLSVSGVDSSTTSTMVPTKGWVNNPETSTNVVHRSGNETIEGTKVLLNNTHIKNSNIEQLTAPDSYSERCLFAVDKNNVRIGSIGFAMNDNGASRTYIESSKVIDGTATYGLIESYTDLNGNHSYYIGGNLVKGFVTTTYQSGTNWYRIYSDGWIEQGGQFAGSTTVNASTTTVTFVKPFTSYVAIAGGFTKTSNNATYGQNIWQNGNTTLTTMVCSLPAYSTNGSVSHASSAGTGYWYACGY